MELTQRFDYSSAGTEEKSSKQVAYLGICGKMYPLKFGHNTIGRDPVKSDILLNMNSISRQHAVINIINENEYMLMDCNSANKTKIMKGNLIALNPFIPYPIKNRDTIQFGDIMGTFRLLEDNDDEDDLPATQIVHVPDTPVMISKTKCNATTTTIPESPDVSVLESSDTIESSSKSTSKLIENSVFIKPNIISRPEIVSVKNEINKWNSSKKSKSICLDSKDSSFINISTASPSTSQNVGFYEMETQPPAYEKNIPADAIYSAETQLPQNSSTLDTVHLPPPIVVKNGSIYEAETQDLFPEDNERAVSVQASASTSIHNLETQAIITEKIQLDLNLSDKENVDEGDDNNIFNADTQLDNREQLIKKSVFNSDKQTSKSTSSIIDDDYTQCDDEDIFLSQPDVENNFDDVTDCEEDISKDKIKVTENITDMATQILEYNSPSNKNNENVLADCEGDIAKQNDRVTENIADMATQVLECAPHANKNNENDLADMLTQVLEENPKQPENSFINFNTFSEEIISPFKIPLQSTFKVKKNNITRPRQETPKDDQYFKVTQELFDVLCSQNQESPLTTNKSTDKENNKDEVLQCSQENYVLGEKFPHIEAQLLSPKSDNSTSSEGEKSINAFVSSLSKQDINNMIGVQHLPLKKVLSDSSDVELTPTKPIRFNDLELPNTQDIKSSVSLPLQNKADTSSESETECSEEQNTPVLFRPKIKPKIDTKKNLFESFDVDNLPTRMTRKSKAMRKEEIDGVDTQIIHENITRLKMKYEKKKETYKESKTINQINNEKNLTEQEHGTNTKKPKEILKSTDKVDNVNKDKSNVTRSRQRKGNNKTEVESHLSATEQRNSITNTQSTRVKNQNREQKPESDLPNRNTKRELKHTVKEPKKCTPSPEKEIEVRRSRRLRRKKEFEPVQEIKSILKNSNQSTVYNVSTVSNSSTSRQLKRPAENDNEAPSSKRSRDTGNSRMTSSRGIKTQYVLLSSLTNEQVKHKLEKLGAKVVTDVKHCTVLLTVQLRRSLKILCAVGLGKPIVGLNWVQACVDTKMIIDPWPFLIHEEPFEKRIGFSLERTLKGRRNYLKGYNISSTPNVLPPENEMKLIVECSGGTWKEGGPRWVCVTCQKDERFWPALKKRGAALVTPEFILKGVLRQQLEIDKHLIVIP